MGGILPGYRRDYRTTPDAFKWIILFVILGTIAFYQIAKYALKNVDEIYQAAGYPDDSRFIKDDKKK